MPPTTVKAKFTRAVAEKIYANNIKGYVPLKPWRGMGQVSWFAFDGTPYAGNLEGEGKTVDLEATVDIPPSVKTLTKADLDKAYQKNLDENLPAAAAEKQMWLSYVANSARNAQDGLLVVEVGGSRFSSRAGKFLLVATKAMQKIKMSDLQMAALLKSLEPDEMKRAVFVSAAQKKVDDKNTDINKNVVLKIRSSKKLKDMKDQEVTDAVEKLQSIPGISTAVVTQEKIRWTSQNGAVMITLTFSHYTVAKQFARANYQNLLRAFPKLARIIVLGIEYDPARTLPEEVVPYKGATPTTDLPSGGLIRS